MVDTDQMPHSVASDQGLHCLHQTVSPNTEGYYGICKKISFGLMIYKSLIQKSK